MKKPPILTLAKAGLVDTVRAVQNMPGLFAVICAASLAVSFLARLLPEAIPDALFTVAVLAASAAVTSAIAVTLHRFVILSETNGAFSLAARWRVLADFTLAVFAAHLFLTLPGLLLLAVWPPAETPRAATFANVAFILAACLFLLRNLLVFPAIAVEAEDRSLEAAARGAGPLVLPVVLACVVAMLLIGLAGSLVGLPILLAAPDTTAAAIAVTAVIEVAVTAATVAIVSRAYLWREGQALP